MNVPVVPVNRYALEDADRLFCFDGRDQTHIKPLLCCQGLKKQCGPLLQLNLFC